MPDLIPKKSPFPSGGGRWLAVQEGTVRSWGDDSGSKVIVIQVCGPEFKTRVKCCPFVHTRDLSVSEWRRMETGG